MNEIKEIYGWSNVPEGWFTKTQLKEKGLKPKSKEDAVGTIYVKSRRDWSLLYKEEDCVAIKKMSAEHKEAIKKSHEKYFCEQCKIKSYSTKPVEEHFKKSLANHKNITMKIIGNHLGKRMCSECVGHFRYRIRVQLNKRKLRQKLNRQKKKGFVVLKIETTGLTWGDEIIQIAIIDQDKKTLLHTYVKPEAEISSEARWLHGKRNEDLENEPVWAEIYPKVMEIIGNKKIFVFNVDFVSTLFFATCNRYKLPVPQNTFECVMWQHMELYENERYISLEEAAEGRKTNEALKDCLLIYKAMEDMINY
ncbi:3'-5' exonuclease [Bacillus cereus]|uniref:3'-5' exonuclease n=1 Tax=Bacillus cereus TaxID=1396 RepID=UPI000994D5DC|nr:exonuclease domain-containing protein [Bacillus cereus]